ncbi:MAG: selenoprotein B, partial [Burkholderiaceae bacterium]
MGRPLGAPHEQAQQTRVLRSALNLLERTDGPVILDDFPEEAPRATAQEMDGMFCPLPAARPAAAAEGDLMAAVTAEVGSLRPW